MDKDLVLKAQKEIYRYFLVVLKELILMREDQLALAKFENSKLDENLNKKFEWEDAFFRYKFSSELNDIIKYDEQYIPQTIAKPKYITEY